MNNKEQIREKYENSKSKKYFEEERGREAEDVTNALLNLSFVIQKLISNMQKYKLLWTWGGSFQQRFIGTESGSTNLWQAFRILQITERQIENLLF